MFWKKPLFQVFVGITTVASALASPVTEYANSVIALSSQFNASGNWSSAQTLGAPNTASYGDSPTAWCPRPQNGSLEYIEDGFPTPIYASAVTIRETWGNGFVYQVDVLDVNDVLHTVWTGTDSSAPGSPADFLVTFPQTSYLVKGVKVYVDTSHNLATWEEIDSIQLQGDTATTGGANNATNVIVATITNVVVASVNEYANSVIALSSQFNASGNWSSAQTLGAPNTASYGDSPNAWCPRPQNGSLEFIEDGFPTPIYASGLTVRETWGNGFVYQIDALDVNNVLHTVWTGADPSLPGAPADFLVSFAQTPYLVKGVKVYLDTNHDPSTWEEIDSLQLHGDTTYAGGGTTPANNMSLTLAWDLPTDPTVAGHVLYWGTASGVYTASNVLTGIITNTTVGNLSSNQSYYFAVVCYDASGNASPFSNEAVYTPTPSAPPAPHVLTGSGVASTPPLPSKLQAKTSPGGSSGGGASKPGSPQQSSGSSANAALNQRYVVGIPTWLKPGWSNQTAQLTVLGSTGAWMVVEATTNMGPSAHWQTFTNFQLTQMAAFATNPPADVVEKAYVPALQTFELAVTNAARLFFRTVQSFNYAVLAGSVLQSKNYTPRLVLVRMPGDEENVCFVPEEGSLIHCDTQTAVVQLLGSGSTIRQMANTLADSLTSNWTTASEYMYSNGTTFLTATVVKTDVPTSDPVPGSTISTISIDF